MKRLLTIVSGLLASASLYALPVLNPAEPALLTKGAFFCDEADCWGVKFGYRGDFVFDRNLVDSEGDVIHGWQYFANEGVLTLNIWDRLDLYGFLGAVSYDYDNIQLTSLLPIPAPGYVIGHSRTRTIWGLGAKAVLWEACFGTMGTSYIGLDVQYQAWARDPLDRASIEGLAIEPNGVGYRYKEIQVALGLAHRIKNFVPYWAVKWSSLRGTIGRNDVLAGVDLASTVALHDFKIERKPVGMAFGVTFVQGDSIDITAEARLVDETACSIAANIRF